MRAEVLKTRVQDFIVFKGPPPSPPPRALIEEPQFGPEQNKIYLITERTANKCNHK